MAKYSNEELTRWKHEINGGVIIATRVNLRRENDEWVGLCPFHTEKTPSFKVYRNDDGVWLFKCFGCQAEGNVFQFVERFDKITFPQAVAKVLEETGTIDPEQVEAAPKPKKIVTFPISHYTQCERALEGALAGQKWITDRGITMETARRFHLGFIQDGTAFCGTDHPWRKDGWIAFPTLSADGKTVHAIKYRSLVDKKRMVGEKLVSGIMRAQDTATMLFNLNEVNELEDVFVCEGEPDALVLSQTGIPATALISSGHKPRPEEIEVLKKAKRRFLAGDNEPNALKAMARLWEKLGANTFMLQWPDGYKDANEVFLKQCGGDQQVFTEYVGRLAANAIRRGPWVDPSKPKPIPPAEFIAQMGDQITPKKIKWLWPDRVPLGKITLFAGNPDNGKSLATMDLAARVTYGMNFPDVANKTKPSEVMMLLGEDDLEDTAVPRLMAAGADLHKIHFPKGMSRPNDNDPEVRLDFDLPAIDTYLEQHPEIRLMIIDPISNYLGDVSMVAEQEARSILIPLKRIAEHRMIAVVIVMHLNKKNELDAISRVGGAMAFIGVARSSWMFIRDAASEEGESKDSFSMARIKGNLTAAGGGGMAYTVKARQIDIPGETEPVWAPYVIWGEKTSQSADEVLEAKRDKRGGGAGRPEGTAPKTQVAIVWLQTALQDGPVMAKQLFKDALDGAGIKADTLRQAGKDLGIKPAKTASGWLWELPVMNATAQTVSNDPEAEEPGEEEAHIDRGFELK